jgi:hypothetical protein
MDPFETLDAPKASFRALNVPMESFRALRVVHSWHAWAIGRAPSRRR